MKAAGQIIEFFAMKPLSREGGRFVLMGCTVAPGFEFADFERAKRAELLDQYPGQGDIIVRLTRE